MSARNPQLNAFRLNRDSGQAGKRDKTALVFGLLAGNSFAAGAYGFDAFALAFSNTMYPFLRFIPALLLFSILGSLAGLLAGKVNRLLLNGLIWGACGFVFSKLAGWLAFEWPLHFFQRFHPELLSLINYEQNAGVETRMNLVLLLVTALSVGMGLLYSPLLEESSISGFCFRRFAPLLIWVTAFMGFAFIGDLMLNQPLRSPLRSLDRMIQYQLDQENIGDNDQATCGKAAGTLDEISDLLDKPRKLLLRSYDLMLTRVNILVDFEGTLVSCSLVKKQGGACKLLE